MKAWCGYAATGNGSRATGHDRVSAPGIDDKIKRVPAAQVGHVGLVIYLNPELEQLRQLVAGARARLAELEGSFTKEKSRVDVMPAVLFRQLREHYQENDRLRLIVDYRRKYPDLLDGTTDFTDDTDKPGEGHGTRGRTISIRGIREICGQTAVFRNTS